MSSASAACSHMCGSLSLGCMLAPIKLAGPFLSPLAAIPAAAAAAAAAAVLIGSCPICAMVKPWR